MVWCNDNMRLIINPFASMYCLWINAADGYNNMQLFKEENYFKIQYCTKYGSMYKRELNHKTTSLRRFRKATQSVRKHNHHYQNGKSWDKRIITCLMAFISIKMKMANNRTSLQHSATGFMLFIIYPQKYVSWNTCIILTTMFL